MNEKSEVLRGEMAGFLQTHSKPISGLDDGSISGLESHIPQEGWGLKFNPSLQGGKHEMRS
jgi:hypothetical protein